MKLRMFIYSILVVVSNNLFADENHAFKVNLNTEYCCNNECIVKISISNSSINLSRATITAASTGTGYLYHSCSKDECVAAFHTTRSNKTIKLNLAVADSPWELQIPFNPSIYGVLNMQ